MGYTQPLPSPSHRDWHLNNRLRFVFHRFRFCVHVGKPFNSPSTFIILLLCKYKACSNQLSTCLVALLSSCPYLQVAIYTSWRRGRKGSSLAVQMLNCGCAVWVCFNQLSTCLVALLSSCPYKLHPRRGRNGSSLALYKCLTVLAQFWVWHISSDNDDCVFFKTLQRSIRKVFLTSLPKNRIVTDILIPQWFDGLHQEGVRLVFHFLVRNYYQSMSKEQFLGNKNIKRLTIKYKWQCMSRRCEQSFVRGTVSR